jgi:protein-arginine kinase activator protein McsA
MSIINPQKNAKYLCHHCEYKTNNKKDYIKHLATLKHINLTNICDLSTKNPQKSQNLQKEFKCKNCGNTYKGRDGLWRHSKKCKEPTVAEVFANNNTQQLTELVLKMVEQNQELTKQIVELAKNSGNNYNNTNNVNSHNKFNLNVFLNETCKDAMNISDFVNSLVVSVKDLEETARLGYSEGISKIFLNGLQDLDTHYRPLHCSDSKREIIYIKDQDKWEKENEGNEKIIKAIKTIAHKNMKMIPEWIKENPDYNDSSSKTNDKYLKLVMNSMSGSTEEEQKKNINKIISNVAKEVVIIK